MKDITIVLLVGGKGLRMGEVTKSRQKLMLEIQGKSVVEHILDAIVEAFESPRVILSTGFRSEDIQNVFGDNYQNAKLEYLYDPDVKGTLWGVVLARKLINKPFMFMGGDVLVHPSHLKAVAEAYDSQKSSPHMGVMSGASIHEPAIRHAIIETVGNRVTHFEPVPRPDCEPHEYRDLHLGVFKPELLEYLETRVPVHSNIEDALHDAIKAGYEFDFIPYNGRWYHFKTREDFQVDIRF